MAKAFISQGYSPTLFNSDIPEQLMIQIIPMIGNWKGIRSAIYSYSVSLYDIPCLQLHG